MALTPGGARAAAPPRLGGVPAAPTAALGPTAAFVAGSWTQAGFDPHQAGGVQSWTQGWLGAATPGSLLGFSPTQQPWAVLNGVHDGVLALLDQSYRGAAGRLGQTAGPTALLGQAAFQNAATALGIQVSGDFSAQLGKVIDFAAGAADTVLAGAVSRLLGWYGYDWLVDHGSAAYRYGTYAGMVVNLAATLVPAVGLALLPEQLLGLGLAAADDLRQGHFAQAVQDATASRPASTTTSPVTWLRAAFEAPVSSDSAPRKPGSPMETPRTRIETPRYSAGKMMPS